MLKGRIKKDRATFVVMMLGFAAMAWGIKQQRASLEETQGLPPGETFPLAEAEERTSAPELVEEKALEGVRWQKYRWAQDPAEFWVFEPTGGDKEHLPALVIPADAKELFVGAALNEQQVPRYQAWAQKGLLVLVYATSGPLPEQVFDEVAQWRKAYRLYHRSLAGLINARDALFWLRRHPRLSPGQIFMLGHGGSASSALVVAAHLEGLAGIIAAHPVYDPVTAIGLERLKELRGMLSGLENMLLRSAPLLHVQRLSCPVYLVEKPGELGEEAMAFMQQSLLNKKALSLVRHSGFSAEEAWAWMQRQKPNKQKLTYVVEQTK